jgi:hypothetical protein
MRLLVRPDKNINFPSIFKGIQERTELLKGWEALPVLLPYLQTICFQGNFPVK